MLNTHNVSMFNSVSSSHPSIFHRLTRVQHPSSLSGWFGFLCQTGYLIPPACSGCWTCPAYLHRKKSSRLPNPMPEPPDPSEGSSGSTLSLLWTSKLVVPLLCVHTVSFFSACIICAILTTGLCLFAPYSQNSGCRDAGCKLAEDKPISFVRWQQKEWRLPLKANL